MNLILFLALGAVSGYLARFLMGLQEKNILLCVAVGIAGSLIGGLLAIMLGLGGISGFNLYSLLISVLGACLLLFLYRVLKRYLR
ncbi:MAG: GlsB/YeaQ/YmgE family stress response membrane protein [Clostridia bacterium]|nr:GlsB/YeaQ/YmgE family stress response membrane protein [Clostridia bacterium]